MNSYKKILSMFCLVGTLTLTGLSTNILHAQEPTATNLPSASLTVLEAEKYVKNDKLYKTVTKLPAVTEKMEALNAVCASVVKTNKLNLVILDMREAIAEKKIKAGYPERLFHAVDTANSIPQVIGNNIVTGSHEFVVIHNKNAKKSLGLEPLIYIKNTSDNSIAKIDLEAVQKSQKPLDKLEDFLSAPKISLAKNSREYAIAQMVFKGAEENAAKKK